MEFPTLQRFYYIFAGFFFTFVVGGIVIGIARLFHALLFLMIRWEGSRTSYLWLVVFIFETLATYWVINVENEYTKSGHGIYNKHTWHRVFATLFLMLLVLVGTWIFNAAAEEYNLRIPFWIQIIIPWLLFIYTEIVRAAYKGQLDREAQHEKARQTMESQYPD